MSSLLLLSGGMDSAALAAWAHPDVGLFLDYGQRAAGAERVASQRVARDLGLAWNQLSIDCSAIGETSLHQSPLSSDLPSHGWWPFRNQLIVTFASAWAVVRGIDDILIGTVATDGTQNADGTASFVSTLDALLAGQEGRVHLRAPAIMLTTEQLIAASGIRRSTLAATYSCHTGVMPCGDCGGCRKREEVIARLA